MKTLKETIVEAFILWELTWTSFQATNAAVVHWTNLMETEGVTPEQFARASNQAQTSLEFPPKPKNILDLIKGQQSALPHYYTEFKPLPMPQEPPITVEQKKQILAGMKNEGAKRMFISVLYGNEHGKLPN